MSDIDKNQVYRRFFRVLLMAREALDEAEHMMDSLIGKMEEIESVLEVFLIEEETRLVAFNDEGGYDEDDDDEDWGQEYQVDQVDEDDEDDDEGSRVRR